VTKGKPWTADQEATLKALVEANTSIDAIAAKLNKKPDTIYVKCTRMGLTQKPQTTPSNIPLPKELPSVEETLKKVAQALETACTPGLDRVEVQRLQVVATLSKTYQELLAGYLNYRGIEVKLNDMEVKYDALLKETGKDDASKPVVAQVAEAPAEQSANPTR
jgi:maleate cis-trans isomerase